MPFPMKEPKFAAEFVDLTKDDNDTAPASKRDTDPASKRANPAAKRAKMAAAAERRLTRTYDLGDSDSDDEDRTSTPEA